MNEKKEAREKRYWWLKLPEDFFRSKEIKYLKRKPNGYQLVCIYQAMMLESLKSGGVLYFDGIGETPEEEIGTMIDEDPELIAIVVDFLKQHGLMIDAIDRTGYCIPYVKEHTGSEGASAQRVRDHREKKTKKDAARGEMLQCNEEMLQCNADSVTLSRRVRDRVELDLEKDTELELELEPEIEDREETASSYSSFSSHPSLDEVKKYCTEKGLKVDPEHFWNYNEARNWMIDGKTINWRQLVATWNKTERLKQDPAPIREPSYGDISQYENADPVWMQRYEENKMLL